MNLEITSCNSQLKMKGVTCIDRYGVNTLAQLHKESITHGKSLSIIGMECEDLYEHFK